MPVAGARGGVREDSVGPGAVLRGLRLLCFRQISGLVSQPNDNLGRLKGSKILTSDYTSAIWAGNSVWIVAVAGQSATETGEGQTVWTGLEQRLVCGLITFVVVITILFVGEHGPNFTLVSAAEVLSRLRWSALRLNCTGFEKFGLRFSCVCSGSRGFAWLPFGSGRTGLDKTLTYLDIYREPVTKLALSTPMRYSWLI